MFFCLGGAMTWCNVFFVFKCFLFLVNSCECLQRFSIVSFDVETHTTKLMVFKLPDQPNVHVWSYFWLLSSVFYYFQEISIPWSAKLLVYFGALEFRMLPPIPKNKYPSMYTFPEKPKVEFFGAQLNHFESMLSELLLFYLKWRTHADFTRPYWRKTCFFWGRGYLSLVGWLANHWISPWSVYIRMDNDGGLKLMVNGQRWVSSWDAVAVDGEEILSTS